MFSMVLLSHSIVNMQCKYQQADTKRIRTTTEIILIGIFMDVKLQRGLNCGQSSGLQPS